MRLLRLLLSNIRIHNQLFAFLQGLLTDNKSVLKKNFLQHQWVRRTDQDVELIQQRKLQNKNYYLIKNKYLFHVSIFVIKFFVILWIFGYQKLTYKLIFEMCSFLMEVRTFLTPESRYHYVLNYNIYGTFKNFLTFYKL